MRGISVIIPVYKDWDTLKICIESLKECIKGEDKVILVNDRSPVWEKNILGAIEGDDRFLYYLNDENMGFVKTCNRAVFELDKSGRDVLLLNSDTKVTPGFIDEMREVLYLSEKHGVVCPRSSNATLLTIPIKNSTGDLLDHEVSRSVFEQMKDVLPRYTVIPTGVGFAFLTRRELVDRYGLFDEIYSPGYNEENDYCARINQYGYNVIMANRAFVYHFEGRSFGKTKSEYDLKNHKTMTGRYPYYDKLVDRYFNQHMNPLEYYADLIADGVYEKPRVLISLFEIPSAFNGTAQYGLSITKAFYERFKDKYDIHILINKEADEFHGVSEKFPNVWRPDNIQGTFHIAYVPSQIIHLEHLFVLNRVALKYVFAMQDIISIRSHYLLMQDYERLEIFRKSIAYCSGIVGISGYTLKDTKDYYTAEFSRRKIPEKVVYHGINTEFCEKRSDEELPFDKYFMVYGNFYKHKYLEETIPYLKKCNANFIILGAKERGQISENIYGYKSGGLTDEFIEKLVSSSVGLLFPSVYEGFGLPFLDGIKYDKKVIVTNNELNRELRDYFDNYSENVLLFDELSELAEKTSEVLASPDVKYKNGKKKMRTWNDAAGEISDFLDTVMSEPLDKENLTARWNDCRYLENVHRMYAQGSHNSIGKWLSFKIWLKDNTPGLFRFLHKAKRLGRE